ncbi:hypothetical protein BsIDN1_37800 [Bacillus safensis]|uniref:DegV family protein n=1 Tax=Bacillus safensis TaxID=561879 RepID=A0A5S9MC50_BACIA|nr:hypothetical protein BsIDN1_37800 [Bacillus safensis]
MKQIKIVTDSTVDLPQEKINDLSIHVIPLNISISGVDYIDRVNIQPDEFIEKWRPLRNCRKRLNLRSVNSSNYMKS